jgi:hypothetical protein
VVLPIRLLAALLLSGPVWAQDVQTVSVEVDLQPHPDGSPTHLFLMGFDQIDSDGDQVDGSHPLEVLSLGLWLREWPVHRQLKLQEGLYYHAVYGYKEQPQPYDPASAMQLFEGQSGPLRFVIPWSPPSSQLSDLETDEQPVEVLIQMGGLRWEGTVMQLMVMAVESMRDGFPRRDALPVEVLQLKGRHYGSTFQTYLAIQANRYYIPVLRNPEGGLIQDIQGIPTLFEGGETLILRFEQEATDPASTRGDDLPPATNAAAVPPVTPDTKEDSSTWTFLALVGGSLSILAILLGLRSRRGPT